MKLPGEFTVKIRNAMYDAILRASRAGNCAEVTAALVNTVDGNEICVASNAAHWTTNNTIKDASERKL